MNREELVKALRGYEGMCHPCSAEKYCKAGVYECQTQYCLDAADLLENDQRHAEALMAEIERLKKYEDKCHDCPIVCAKTEILKAHEEIDALRKQLETVAAERDAAVEDLESLMCATRHYSCMYCLQENRQCNAKKRKDRSCIPKWRGQQKEAERDD